MKKVFLLSCLISINLVLPATLLAQEGVVMQQREWKEVYSAPSNIEVKAVPLSFSQVTEVATGQIPDRLTGKQVEMQGFLEVETENSFRLYQDGDPIFKHCSSCVKKRERESPRIFAPAEVIQKLKPGLVRIRGTAKYRPIALTVEEPVLIIGCPVIEGRG